MNLKIKDLKVHVLRIAPPVVSYSPDHGPTGQKNRYIGVLRIISNDGLEGHCFVGHPLNDNTHGILPLVEQIKPMLVGQDVWSREPAWRQLREMAPRWDVRDSTIMAVDVALWDLAAKACDIPLYQFMGTCRTKVHACASAPYHDDVEANVEEALMYKERGFVAYKLHHGVPNLRKVVQVCAAVRRAVGDDMDLMFDCVGRYSLGDAIFLGRALDELRFRWYEDPMGSHDLDALADLSRRLDTPLAISDSKDFRFVDAAEAIKKRAASIILGDPNKDGITGVRKLAALSEANNLHFQAHYGGNSLMQVAVLHLALSISNTDLFPWAIPAEPMQFGLVEDLVVDREGYVSAPEKAGLGVDIDWAGLESVTEAVL